MKNDDASRPIGGTEPHEAGKAQKRTGEQPEKQSAEQVEERMAVLHAPALQFDPADYRHFLDGDELTEDQQNELLRALWVIMVGFVDLGFNISPVQSALPVQEFMRALVGDSAAVVECENSIQPRTEKASCHNTSERIRSDS